MRFLNASNPSAMSGSILKISKEEKMVKTCHQGNKKISSANAPLKCFFPLDLILFTAIYLLPT
jgi:hypothetical protein